MLLDADWYRAIMSSDFSATGDSAPFDARLARERDSARLDAHIARERVRARVRQTHREFQEFVTLVESKYAFWLPLAESPDLGIPYDTWERETRTLVVVRRLWEYVIDLDTGVRHEMEYFAAQWKLWPRLARYELTAIAEMPDRDPASLVWVLIDEKSAELTRKCLADASISEVDVIGIEEWLSRKGRTGETVPFLG
ncbi:hypothetical protein CPI83_28905 (plasmid) [Rhodococcus sp. H-CA8f]|nr:hypothetical protein CPI83_28905 [Rhodococcus sp. H-CA8f]